MTKSPVRRSAVGWVGLQSERMWQAWQWQNQPAFDGVVAVDRQR
jgi:hypothetical protein